MTRNEQVRTMVRRHAENRLRKSLEQLADGSRRALGLLEAGQSTLVDIRNLGAPFADAAEALGVLRCLVETEEKIS